MSGLDIVVSLMFLAFGISKAIEAFYSNKPKSKNSKKNKYLKKHELLKCFKNEGIRREHNKKLTNFRYGIKDRK